MQTAFKWTAVIAFALAVSGCNDAKMEGIKPESQSKTNATPPTHYQPPQDPVYPDDPEEPEIVTPQPEVRPDPVVETEEPVQPKERLYCEPTSLKSDNTSACKLDALLVVDTSASLRGGRNQGTAGELGQLARDMHYFMDQIDKGCDVRIGMMLGHGPAMQSTHGKLFASNQALPQDVQAYVGSRDMHVIDYKAIQSAVQQRHSGYSAEKVRETAKEIIGKILEFKMIVTPKESGGAQGEALMLSLYDAFSKSSLLSLMQSQGLAARGAPLAVITIADEQDVCFDYAANGVTPRNVDPIETRFFKAECAGITPESVYSALQRVAGDKLILGGIHYKNNNVRMNAEDENEQGHGYIELIEKLGHGRVADLGQISKSNPDFFAALSDLGAFAEARRRFNNTFTCNGLNVDFNRVNISTLEVKIISKSKKQIALFANQCEGDESCVEGIAGKVQWSKSTGKARVNEQTLDGILKAENVSEGTAQISFKMK